MSTQHYFICEDCKKSIEAGQAGMSGIYLFTGIKDCMDKLTQFLFFDHIYHNLKFVQEAYAWEDEDNEDEKRIYEEIEWKYDNT